MIPEHIGPYRIIEKLGEGGLAVVYLAEQSEPIQRQVALKMIKPGMDSDAVVKRFESERQALAVLEHPNIASVFDAGVTDSALPYFAMELVHGESITDYCDNARLTTRQRIGLFVDVCAAVQHAHLKGLIHRDIKPSNVLVAEQDGVPLVKVIDFGVAKAVESEAADDQLTRLGAVVGTPQYMSPEQITGSDIDTRVDVYALGVLLYELLAGAAPIDMTGVSLHSVGYLIREKEPPTPSARLRNLKDSRVDVARARSSDVPALTRELAGDLDWIVMRSVAKDRDQRYETARALADDLGRYLRHEPVAARPPRTGYVVRRFVRRNRVAVIAGATAALALVGGTAATAVGFLQARNAERQALQEAQTSKQIADFMVSVFAVSDPSEAKGKTLTAREVLETGAAKIDTELADQPEVQTTLMFTMADVYKNLGLYADSTRLSEAALNKRRQLGTDPADLANSLDQLGALKKAAGELDAAEALHDESLQLRRSSGDADSAEAVATLQHLAEIEYLRADFNAAERRFVEALDIANRLNPPPTAILAELRGNLGAIYHRAGDLERAETFDRRALAGFIEAHGPVHPNVATMQNNVAFTMKTRGRFDEAAAMYEQALATYEKLYDGQHPLIANTMNNLALVYGELDLLDDAAAMSRNSLTMYQSILGEEHTQVATVQTNLARILMALGELDNAEKLQRDSYAMQRRLLKPGHRRIALAELALASTLNMKEEFEEAESLARLAYDLLRERGAQSTDTARASGILGHALAGLGRFEEAEPLLLDGYAMLSESLSQNAKAVAATADSIVWLYESWDKPARLEAFNAEQRVND